MSDTYQYRGRLSETTLPEMLHSIDRFQMAGLIEARHGDTVKRIWLRDGSVVHAASTDRHDSLGEYLLRAGKLDDRQLRDLSRLRRTSERRFGVLLVERELLSPLEVYRAIREHIEEIVWSLFNWRQGEVSFSIGKEGDPDQEMVRIQLPLRQVILQGIRRAPDARTMIGRLGKRETVLEPCFKWEDLIEIGLDRDEYKMLLMVDARKSLYQLCSDGPLVPAENGKLLYAFQVLNLVRRRDAAEAKENAGPVKIRLKTTGDTFTG